MELIAATPGLNALMLGPGDLRVSLGLPSKKVGEFDDPRFLASVDRLVEVSKKYSKPLMTVAFKVSAHSEKWISKFSLLLTSADIITVTNGHRQDLANMKNLLQENEDKHKEINGFTDPPNMNDQRVQPTTNEALSVLPVV